MTPEIYIEKLEKLHTALIDYYGAGWSTHHLGEHTITDAALIKWWIHEIKTTGRLPGPHSPNSPDVLTCMNTLYARITGYPKWKKHT